MLIGWAHVSSELVSRWNPPLKWVLKKFKAKCNAYEFWMQLFHQLWKKIGMQKWMWNCGIERGLFNPNSFSTTREKTSSGRLALHEEWKFRATVFERWILRFTSRRLIFKTEATLSPGNWFVGTYSIGCEKKNGSFKKFLQLVRTLCLRISSIQNSVFPRGRSKPRKQRWIKLNRFHFYL